MARKNLLMFFCAFTLFTSLACLAVERAIFGDEKPSASTSTGAPTSAPQTTCASTDCLSACIADLNGVHLNNPNRAKNLELNQEKTLVTYDINGENIFNPQISKAAPKFKPLQDDLKTHQAIWRLFADIIPPEERGEVAQFVIFTDGQEEVLASVYQTDYDPALWALEVDIADAGNTKELIYTLIHEFAHLLTLNAKQVPPSVDVFNHPDNDAIYNKAVNACPNYFPGEGCSQPNSYINLFVAKFWGDIYDEWSNINAIKNDDKFYAALDKFYETYANQFVSDYAPTSPEEDIAESFMYFALEKKPETIKQIANQKILFFYNFPELVHLRQRIINQICANSP
jgi:hypothetical protein